MATLTCPPRDRLEALLAGRLPAEQAAELSRHVETCPSCAASAARLGSAGATVPPDATVPPTNSLATGPGLPPDANLSFLAPPQAPDELGRLGSYRVLKVLGKGGMGLVLQAEDPKLGRLCALKVMLPEIAQRPEMKERFLREAKAAAQVEHEHIIPIYQVDEDRGVPFIAMPFLKGSSLEAWLVKKRGPLPVREILKLGREIARGLAAAHERGLIHRDIKPANVWLDSTAGGKVKILDFGLARLANRNDGGNERNLTQTGMIIGTPAYMSPEQAQGLAGNVDARTDLFALGCVLYRLCTGVGPFKGTDIISTLVSVAMDNPPPPVEQNPGIPLALSELVMRLLAKNRDGRPASAHDVVKSLQAIEKSLQVAVPATQPDAPMPVETEHAEADRGALPAGKPGRMPVGLIVGGIAAVIVAAVAGAVMFWQTPKGVVRVEIADDAKIKVAVDQEEFTVHGAGPHDIKVRPGSHGLRVRLGDLEFQTRKFDVTKGETVLVRVELLDGKVQVVNDGNIIGSADVPSPSVVARPKEAPPKEVPPKEVPPGEARPNSSPPQSGAAPKTIAGWGDVVDPDGDCKVTTDGGRVTFQLPGGVHNLQAARQNSPRVLQDVEGDFSVQVKVASAIRTDIGTVAPGVKSPAVRAGALLIWQDARNFIRLDRESRVIDGKSLPLCWLEPYANGKTLFTDGQNHGIAHMEIVPDLLTDLRLERRQGKCSAAYSLDGGTTWKPIGPPRPFAVDLAAKVKVGVSAINTTVVPLTVEFENLVIANDRVGPGPFEESFRNKFDIEFVRVARGKAWLGGGNGRPGSLLVEIPYDFYIGKYEVTQGEWEKLMGGNPSHFRAADANRDPKRLPVEKVSRELAHAFIAKLNEQDKQPGWVYRLPTPAEWEYACRGGPMTDPAESTFSYYLDKPANELRPDQANFSGSGKGRTVVVGSYQPNKLGIYDMHGNVSEWVAGPRGLGAAGGSFAEDAGNCRVIRGGGGRKNVALTTHGLRVVRAPVGAKPSAEPADAPDDK